MINMIDLRGMSMETKRNTRRPVVAFFNGNIHDPHSMTMIKLLYEGFQEDDIEFHYYMGADLHGFMEDNLLKNLRAENHYYSLFSYVAYDSPDIIIITMGGLTNSREASSAESFLSHFPGVPIILLENDTQYPKVTHVLVDNYAGMYAAVKHLIKDHGYKKIVHLAGPQKNEEAVLRRKAYENAMSDYGMQECVIAYGDYTKNVDEQVKELLDTQPDAIVSANDVMANVVYRYAQERGMQIGVNLAVTGFDDAKTSALLEPPLTTVKQDYSRIADAVLSQVRSYLRGEPRKDVLIPANLIRRCSCGCSLEAAKSAAVKEQILTHNMQIDQMIFQGLETTFVLRNMLYQQLDRELMFRELGQTLCELGAKRSFILLYDNPLYRNKREVVDAPAQIRIAMQQEGQKVISYSEKEGPIIHKGELRKWVTTDERTTFTDFVLYFQELEYGVLIADIEPAQLLHFYSLSLEIGSGLRYLQLALDQESVNRTLEEKNQILNYVASHDNLTSLYNRAGIMSELMRYVHSFPGQEQFLLVMADLDHLKQINDTFGHNEGDLALKQVSRILEEVLPEGSPIGRNGGDEFLAVVRLSEVPVDEADMDEEKLIELKKNSLRKQLLEVCDKKNIDRESYYVDISAGFSEFCSRDLGRILQIVKKADQDLYDDKKNRRLDVRKGNHT